MGDRRQNEKKFGRWRDLANGGRCYELEIAGKHGWSAKYYKEVDARETTVRFWQEIFDESGALVEIHEKYPNDKGHRKV